ncbi:hypothetical protein MTO96_030025 [Rhipicephalus appendiculatus]
MIIDILVEVKLLNVTSNLSFGTYVIRICFSISACVLLFFFSDFRLLIWVYGSCTSLYHHLDNSVVAGKSVLSLQEHPWIALVFLPKRCIAGVREGGGVTVGNFPLSMKILFTRISLIKIPAYVTVKNIQCSGSAANQRIFISVQFL